MTHLTRNRISRLRSLIIKEALTLLRDKRSRIILIAPPLLQLLIFSFAATREVKNISLAIANYDSGIHSQELIQRISASPSFTRIYTTRDNREIEEYLDTQQVMAAMIIEPDFSKEIEAGRQGNVQLLLDGRKSVAAQSIANYIGIINNNYGIEISRVQGRRISPVMAVHRNWFNPNLRFIWFTLPSMVVILAVLIVLIVTSLSVARERELGTFDQLLVSPLMPLEILAGKTIPAMLIGMFEGLMVFTLAVTLFRVPFTGSFVYLILALMVFILSIVGVGLFISSIARTQQQAILYAFIFLVPTILLSGYASPVDNMPIWLQRINVINPLVYYFTTVKGLFLKDMPFHLVWQNLWPPLIIGTIALTIASWMFTRRES